MFGFSPRAVALQWAICSFVISSVSAYEAASRWGQATAVVNEVVFVYGGKTDQYNQFGYTAAPNNNDILLLSLSSPFSGNSPPWELVAGSANQSSSQGPALAWSTLSALNNTLALLFGGQTDADSSTSGGTAELLDVYSRIQPNWTTQLVSAPPPRMRHSSATASSGLVFIFGGEKPDGSEIAFSDHFYFDANTLSFTSLSTDNAPPDIFGHASIILPDGRILVFGGYSPSQGMLPLSTIWILDTANLTWTVITTASSSLPSPRIAFATTLILNGKIIIHGGSDEFLQTNFADGWVLDTTQNPMTWTAVVALSQLGGLRDHFAVPSGDQVIFGFGYADNGPAPASLQIYNITSGNFVPGYLPPPATVTPTQTLPQPTQTQTDNAGTLTTSPYSSTAGIHPTSTYNPQDPNDPLSPNSGDDNGNSTSHMTAIAVGASFGIISLIVVGLGAAYYIRKRRRDSDSHFVAIGDDDDGRGSPHFGGDIPVANIIDEQPPRHRRLLNTLGISGAISAASRMRSVRSAVSQRRDMLADEDARSLREWYSSQRRDGAGNSSWSLLSILAGTRRSRNASTTSHGTGGLPTPWREKSDPFADGSAIDHEEAGLLAPGVFGSRPHSRRDASYASYASSRSAASYRDPFLDPYLESEKPDFSPTELYAENASALGDGEKGQPSVRYVPPLQTLRPAPPLSQQLGHPLSPLSEHTSQSTLPHIISSSGSSNTHSSENIIFSPITGGSASRATSRTSLGLMPTPISSSSSPILGGHPDNMLSVPTQPMRRSDSWWSKFSRTSLLDRRSNAGAKAGYDIRDPNPAPKLTAIEEGSLRSTAIEEGSLRSTAMPIQNSPPASNGSPGSAEHDKQLRASAATEKGAKSVYATAAHGKSMSSVRTADTEAIERMAGTMDVVHRESRHRWSASMSSQGGLSIDMRSLRSEGDESQTTEGGESQSQRIPEDEAYVSSPVGDVMTPRASRPSRLPSPPPVQKALRFAPIAPPLGERIISGSKVSDRIQAYERRMSQEPPSSPPPSNSKYFEERVKRRVEVDYGLVPRPSLFVANPDHRTSARSSSS